MNLKRKISLSISATIAALLLLGNFAHGQDCKKLDDGKYRVKFKKEYGGASYVLLLEGDHFTKLMGGREIKGKIDGNGDCTLRLNYMITSDTTTNAVQRVLSKSSMPYFEFQTTRGRRLKFRLTGYAGPHTTSGEGQLIKKR